MLSTSESAFILLGVIPLESNHLVPNVSFVLAVVVMLLLLTAIVATLVWVVSRRARG